MMISFPKNVDQCPWPSSSCYCLPPLFPPSLLPFPTIHNIVFVAPECLVISMHKYFLLYLLYVHIMVVSPPSLYLRQPSIYLWMEMLPFIPCEYIKRSTAFDRKPKKPLFSNLSREEALCWPNHGREQVHRHKVMADCLLSPPSIQPMVIQTHSLLLSTNRNGGIFCQSRLPNTRTKKGHLAVVVCLLLPTQTLADHPSVPAQKWRRLFGSEPHTLCLAPWPQSHFLALSN